MSRAFARAAGALLLLALTAAAPRSESPVVQTLPNGLRVAVFVRPGLPVVQAQLQVPAGLRAEAPGHAGLAFLTAQMLRQGTTSRSADDFATELDTLGATFAVNVNRDAAQVAAGCRVNEFESLMELVSDAVVNPLFSDESFLLMRRQVATQLGVQAQNPAAIADEQAASAAFGRHPYGHAVLGNLSGLLGATRDQVREFHRDRWRPDAAVLAITGDIDPGRAFATAREWFGRWTGESAPAPTPDAPEPRHGTLLLDLPSSPVAEIRAFALAPGRGAPGFAAWTLATDALKAKGLPPGAQVSLAPAREASLFMVSTSARPDSAAAVAARVRGALRDFAANPPHGDGLARLRREALGAWPLTIETHGQLLSTWLAGEAAGLPDGHLGSMVDSLRTADPAGAAHGLSDGLTLLVVGPGERMKGLRATLGRVDTLRLEATRTRTVAEAPVTPEDRARGRKLVQQAVAAHGGEARLRAVKTSLASGDLEMAAAGRELTGEMRFFRVDPARLVYTTRFLDFEHHQVLDGDRGWTLSLAGDSATLVPADTTSLSALRAILASDLVHVLREASAPTAGAVARGAAALDGVAVERVEFRSPHTGRTRLSLDAKSSRVVAVETLPTPQGTWRDRRRWSDFAQVEGVWWPRREVREVDGEQVSAWQVRTLEVNGPVDSTLFRRPVVARGKVRGME